MPVERDLEKSNTERGAVWRERTMAASTGGAGSPRHAAPEAGKGCKSQGCEKEASRWPLNKL